MTRSPGMTMRSGVSLLVSSTIRWSFEIPLNGEPTCRSASTATRRPESSGLQLGMRSVCCCRGQRRRLEREGPQAKADSYDQHGRPDACARSELRSAHRAEVTPAADAQFLAALEGVDDGDVAVGI